MLKNFALPLSAVIISSTAVILAALINTTVGKIVLILIAAKIAVWFGMDVTSLSAMKDFAKENPAVAAEVALDWIL